MGSFEAGSEREERKGRPASGQPSAHAHASVPLNVCVCVKNDNPCVCIIVIIIYCALVYYLLLWTLCTSRPCDPPLCGPIIIIITPSLPSVGAARMDLHCLKSWLVTGLGFDGLSGSDYQGSEH